MAGTSPAIEWPLHCPPGAIFHISDFYPQRPSNPQISRTQVYISAKVLESSPPSKIRSLQFPLQRYVFLLHASTTYPLTASLPPQSKDRNLRSHSFTRSNSWGRRLFRSHAIQQCFSRNVTFCLAVNTHDLSLAYPRPAPPTKPSAAPIFLCYLPLASLT